ncbi:MAG: SEC-C domain-containing protein [Blastocatellia bacterium]
MQLKEIYPNSPCPCGSGTVFSKCCGPQVVNEMRHQVEQQNFPGPPLLKFESGKHVFRIVGSRIFQRDRGERLHAFTVHWLYWKFGLEWFKKQDSLPEEDRHIVARWLPLYWKWNNENYLSAQVGPNRKADSPGVIREFITLASDVYTLILVEKIPKSLLDRLRDVRQYQGARYEVAVAAALVRAGFTISWKKGGGGSKIYEFDATHKKSNETIAVEAKSKVRKGAIHEKGEIEPFNDARADIIRLYNSAVSKRPNDKPFAVFIDINTPHDLTVIGPYETWTKQILSLIEKESLFKDNESSEHSVLAITNSAWHYDGIGQTGDGRHILMWTEKAVQPIKHPHTLAAIQYAMTQFGIILDD